MGDVRVRFSISDESEMLSFCNIYEVADELLLCRIKERMLLWEQTCKEMAAAHLLQNELGETEASRIKVVFTDRKESQPIDG
ncbi:hypothetical protein JQN58_13820 [Aneurinibacillus sp. BA2021]|nr:hypothetical protein [Aneurinibacillus sp. BA2021]